MADTSTKQEPLYCKRPDRHVPKLECSYPLPCPWHTYTIDLKTVTVEVPPEGSGRPIRRLQQIATVLSEEAE